MKRLYVLLGVLTIAGCSASGGTRHTQIYDREGKQAHLLECGTYLPWCHERARQICGGPYITLEGNTGTAGVPQYGGGTLIMTTHTLTVRCQ